MKAIILAAGMGTRSRLSHPKCLTEINGIPIIEKQIESLRSNDILDISIVVGFKKEEIKEKCKDLEIKFYTNERFDRTGMLESLYCAKEKLNDDVLILYGDLFLEKEAIKRLVKNGKDICLGIDGSKEINPKEEKAFEDYHGKIINKGSTKVRIESEIIKEIGKGIENPDGEFMGVIKISKQAAPRFLEKLNQLVESGEIVNYPSPSYLIKSLISDGERIGVSYIMPGEYLEINYPEDLVKAKKKFSTKIKAILFDAEDVLYYRDDETLKPIIDFFNDREIDVSTEKFREAYDKDKMKLFKNQISKDEHLRGVLKYLGINDMENQFFEEFYGVFRESYSKFKKTEGINELFKEISKKGIKIAILTDTMSSSEKRWQWLKSENLDKFVTAVICSSETGFTKDQGESFETALKIVGTLPKETLFVGHKKYEMIGAKKANVHAGSLEKNVGEEIYIMSLNNLKNLI